MPAATFSTTAGWRAGPTCIYHRRVLGAWLLTWGIAVAAFLTPLLMLGVLREIRKLRREGVPRAAFVTWRRYRRWLPWPASRLDDVIGRDAFVLWDRRWLDMGHTTAKVTGVHTPTHELQLELAQPIGKVRTLTFTPDKPSRASYAWSSVQGTLTPAVDGVTPTAEVVLYPVR